MSDIICTSSNAEKIIDSLPKYEKIIFAPDNLLGTYLKGKTGRDLLLWNGSCQVHEIFSEKELILLKICHPSSLVLAHPECNDDILHHAHHIGSTTSIIHFTIESTENEFIIATEPSVIHQIKKHSPEKKFLCLQMMAVHVMNALICD